jgi:transglutaminase-like putative cysteine protease
MKILSLLIAIVGLLLWSGFAFSENYTLKGDMASSIRYELQEKVTTASGIKKMIFSFVVPQDYQSPTYKQKISDFDIRFDPEPQERKVSTDERGNKIVTAVWTKTSDAIDVRLSFNTLSETNLKVLETQAPFPLDKIDQPVRYYLKATEQVQSDDPRIQKLAADLTENVKTEFDAVQRIVSWVVDHVHYMNPPEQYDAVYSFNSGKGNCQNFSHLSAALLRSVGVPVRIVNGITLNQPYDIAWQKGVLTFKMGQGRHSWIEVWFPDLGWAPFDPQNTVLFVSNRFIRVEVGVDNNETKNDGLLRWAQLPEASRPKLQEIISANFNADNVQVQGDRESYGPKNILLCPNVKAQFKPIEIPPPPPPPPVVTEPEKKEFRYEVPFIYGNLAFPEGIDFAFPRVTKKAGKNQFEMAKNFLVETAEYVTGERTQYAQIVVLSKPVNLEKVGLALHNFGGDGWLWVDVFEDNNGEPGKRVATSNFIALEEISQKPGYRWVDFDMTQEETILMPGSYWIALGFTGSPVVNWFYTYGKPVGPAYGTRYKRIFQDNDWSGALNYEFNYRVTGLTVK